MKRICLLAAALLGVLLWVGPASAGEQSGVRGVVLNTTCYGPCIYPPPPPPRYEGDDLRVVIRRLPSLELVVVLHPNEGRFGRRLPAGAYRLRPAAGKPGSFDGRCWEGQGQRVQVSAGEFTRVRLRIANTCIV
jgi:hypothetical protein